MADSEKAPEQQQQATATQQQQKSPAAATATPAVVVVQKQIIGEWILIIIKKKKFHKKNRWKKCRPLNFFFRFIQEKFSCLMRPFCVYVFVWMDKFYIYSLSVHLVTLPFLFFLTLMRKTAWCTIFFVTFLLNEFQFYSGEWGCR